MSIVSSLATTLRKTIRPMTSTLQDQALEPGDEVADLYHGSTFVVVVPKAPGSATFKARQKGLDLPVVTCHVADFYNDRGVK